MAGKCRCVSSPPNCDTKCSYRTASIPLWPSVFTQTAVLQAWVYKPLSWRPNASRRFTTTSPSLSHLSLGKVFWNGAKSAKNMSHLLFSELSGLLFVLRTCFVSDLFSCMQQNLPYLLFVLICMIHFQLFWQAANFGLIVEDIRVQLLIISCTIKLNMSGHCRFDGGFEKYLIKNAYVQELRDLQKDPPTSCSAGKLHCSAVESKNVIQKAWIEEIVYEWDFI